MKSNRNFNNEEQAKNIESYLEYRNRQMANTKNIGSFGRLNVQTSSAYKMIKDVIYLDSYTKGLMNHLDVMKHLNLSTEEFTNEMRYYENLSHEQVVNLLDVHVELYYCLALSLLEVLEELKELGEIENLDSLKTSATAIAGIYDESYADYIASLAGELHHYLFSKYEFVIDKPSMYRVVNEYINKGINIEEVAAVFQLDQEKCLKLIKSLNNISITELSELLECQQEKINLMFEPVRVICNFILKNSKKSYVGVSYRKSILNDYNLVNETLEYLNSELKCNSKK